MKTGLAFSGSNYTYPSGSGTQFTDGCNAIWAAGHRVLKIYCTGDYGADYPYQTSFHKSGVPYTPVSCADLLASDEYLAQLTRGWHTIIITMFPFATTTFSLPVGQRVTNWWRVAMSTTTQAAHAAEMKAAGIYCLANGASGTIFIFQNWEGDWAFMDKFVSETYVDRWLVNHYSGFFGIRQRAINEARMQQQSSCTLLHCFEANKVLEARTKPHLRRILRDIAPFIQPDVVSWSHYDGSIDTPIGFGSSYAAWSAYHVPLMNKGWRQLELMFPGVPKLLGEFGFPEVQAAGIGRDIAPMIQDVYDAALAHAVRWFIYWQIFDNEYITPGVPASGDRGYGAIRRDGTVGVAGAKMTALAPGA